MVGGSRTADWAVIGWRSLAVLAALLAPFGLYTPLLGQERSPENSPVPTLNVGHSIFPLNGPWRFHTGDDFDGADPDFNDSEWETVALTAAPGAHDWDVGLTNYVQGWTARGHTGHSGYAWYRIRLWVGWPPGDSLALSAPPFVWLPGVR